MTFDIISIGDATIDNFFFFHDVHVTCKLRKQDCVLEIPFGTKLPVDKYVRTVAGNAANNAVGSARLGLKTAFYSVLGDDPSGHEIKKSILAEGISGKYIQNVKKQATNISAVLSVKGERTILVYHVERNYSLPLFEKTDWIYLTSMGPLNNSLKKLHIQIELYLKKNPQVKLGFNPGTHQLKMRKEGLLPLFKRTEVLFVNKEEAELICEKKGGMKIEFLLQELYSFGIKIVVITDGEKGSYIFDGKKMFSLPIFPARVIERTGCGDSYATAFICALQNNNSISEAMKWGTFNAASVLGEIGPEKGLLTKKQMERYLRKNKKFEPKEKFLK